MVQIWPGQTVTCLHTNSPGHIWTTLYSQICCVDINDVYFVRWSGMRCWTVSHFLCLNTVLCSSESSSLFWLRYYTSFVGSVALYHSSAWRFIKFSVIKRDVAEWCGQLAFSCLMPQRQNMRGFIDIPGRHDLDLSCCSSYFIPETALDRICVGSVTYCNNFSFG